MLRLILGRAGAGKTGQVMRELQARTLAARPGAVLIVPEQYSHEAERELCRVCGDQASLCAEVLSFTRLAARGELEAGRPGGRLLDAGGRLLCMALALDAVGSRLAVYGEARRRAELQKRLLDTVDELKAACLTPAALEQAAACCHPALGDKLRDLALVLAAYDAVVANGWADPTDRLDRLTEHLEAGRFSLSGPVYVDGFTDFTRQELAVLRSLLKRGLELCVCLTCGREEDSEVFTVTWDTIRALRRMAEDTGTALEEQWLERAADSRPPALAFLDEHLFTYTSRTCPDPQGAVTLWRAANPAAECECCAAHVLSLVQRSGCRWRDVAVAVRGFEDYRAPLESAFALYGIPLYAARRSALAEKNPCALIDLAYALLDGGWETEDMTAYLRTGLLGLSREETDALENYIFLWRLRGGAWTRNRDWSLHPEGHGQPSTPESEALLAELNRLRRAVSGPLLRLEAESRRAETALGQVRALARFLEELDLAEGLGRRAALLERAGQDTLAAEYSQLWEILVNALEQCADILGDLPMDRQRFARLWQVALGQYDIGTIPVALDRVSAGDLDRMRRRHLKHLVVLGCTDARLPRISGDEGLFTDEEREQLLALDLPLGGGAEGLYRELNLIYHCLTLPGESLALVYSPGAEGEGAGFVLGSIARMLEKPIQTPSQEAQRLLAPGPALLLAARGGTDAAGRAAAGWFRARGQAARLEALDRAAHMGRGRLSPAAVRKLYGRRLTLTASRADKLASCKFAFFLQYGLRARPRRPAGFEAPELGAFMHDVLENVAREAGQRGGFAALSRRDTDAMAEKYVAAYVSRELNDFRDRSPRFVYLFRRLTATVRQVVGDMAEELRRSDFQPLDFELDFSSAGDLPPVELGAGDLRLSGIADRVDGWLHEGRLYLRVVDYKTGRRDFSLSDVCQGMGLQMLLYLFALEQQGAVRYGHEIVPAGVLYVPARDAVVSADREPDEEELARARQRALRRSGLLLAEPAVLRAMEKSDEPAYIPVTYKNGDPAGKALATAEQLGLLGRHIQKTLSELAAELRDGALAADPYFRSQNENACAWCEYQEACHFDEGQDSRRYLIPYKEDAAWAIIRERGEDHG